MKNKFLSFLLISIFSILSSVYTYASSDSDEEEMDKIDQRSRPSGSQILGGASRFENIKTPKSFLKKEALKYSERSSLKPEIVFKLREEQLDFIKDNEVLKKVHANLSEKLTRCLISYKEIDPTVHAAHLLISSLSSASVLLFSGISTFNKENKTVEDYFLGSAQICTAGLSISIAHIAYPKIANWFHGHKKKWKILPIGEKNKITPLLL